MNNFIYTIRSLTLDIFPWRWFFGWFLVGIFFFVVYVYFDPKVGVSGKDFFNPKFYDESDGTSQWLKCLYFSFITLTTIGFGDFHPVADIAKLLVVLESAIGMFIVAGVAGTFMQNISRARNRIYISELQFINWNRHSEIRHLGGYKLRITIEDTALKLTGITADIVCKAGTYVKYARIPLVLEAATDVVGAQYDVDLTIPLSENTGGLGYLQIVYPGTEVVMWYRNNNGRPPHQRKFDRRESLCLHVSAVAGIYNDDVYIKLDTQLIFELMKHHKNGPSGPGFHESVVVERKDNKRIPPDKTFWYWSTGMLLRFQSICLSLIRR